MGLLVSRYGSAREQIWVCRRANMGLLKAKGKNLSYRVVIQNFFLFLQPNSSRSPDWL